MFQCGLASVGSELKQALAVEAEAMRRRNRRAHRPRHQSRRLGTVAPDRPRCARRPSLRHQLARSPRCLAHDPRLIPLRFFTLGGTYEDDNLAVKEAAQCMRIRGPLAQTLYSLPDGAHFHMTSTPPPNDPDLLSHHELEVFADYSTLLIQDDDARLGEPEPAWFETLVEDWINTAPGIVGIGAARPFDVPVAVDVRRTPPTDDDVELQQADHVTQASLALPSGRLLISMQDFDDELPRIALTPGTYAVRAYSNGLHTISEDGLDGEDRYHVVLWPTDEDHPAQVLKRYPEPLPGG